MGVQGSSLTPHGRAQALVSDSRSAFFSFHQLIKTFLSFPLPPPFGSLGRLSEEN